MTVGRRDLRGNYRENHSRLPRSDAVPVYNSYGPVRILGVGSLTGAEQKCRSGGGEGKIVSGGRLVRLDSTRSSSQREAEAIFMKPIS
jgi:hypothetical protein